MSDPTGRVQHSLFHNRVGIASGGLSSIGLERSLISLLHLIGILDIPTYFGIKVTDPCFSIEGGCGSSQSGLHGLVAVCGVAHSTCWSGFAFRLVQHAWRSSFSNGGDGLCMLTPRR